MNPSRPSGKRLKRSAALRASAISLLLLVPGTAICAGVSLNPNDIPAVWSLTNNSTVYHDAAFKAQEAFLVQSGFTAMYNKLGTYVSEKATRTIADLIDRNTPLSSKDVYTLMGSAYAVGIRKQLSKSFSNPFWPKMNNTITLGVNIASIGATLPF